MSPFLSLFSPFWLPSGVGVYGGFDGTESAREERDWTSHVTVLSGDLNRDDTDEGANRGENSYHVVRALSVTDAILDGFTITAGNADGASLPDNRGGGMLNMSTATLTNVTFSGNSAADGGGMYNYDNSPATLTNVTFSGNSAYAGGGMFNHHYSTATLTNVTFSGNSARYYGGGMYNYSSPATLTNSILWGNTATWGPQIYGSATVTYSIVQGGWTGAGNLSDDPLFLRPPSPGDDGTWGTEDDDYGDLRLQPGSPAIDAGTATGAPSFDLDGNPRPYDGDGDGTPKFDMGAYEYVNSPPVADDQSVTANEDTAAPITLTATDPDEDQLNFEIVLYPSHGTLTDFDPVTGYVVYMPDPDYDGDDSFTFKANDGVADSDVATVSITVLSAEAQTEAIIDEVFQWVDEGFLGAGECNGLVSNLDSAIAQLEDGKAAPAVNKLEAFENKIEALVKSGRVSAEEADALIAMADAAIHSILAGSEDATDAAFADLGGDATDSLLESPLLADLVTVGTSKPGKERK